MKPLARKPHALGVCSAGDVSAMPQSFACLHLHVVFSTRQREPLIAPDLMSRLCGYWRAAVPEVGRGCVVVHAGGVADHAHLLVGLGRETTVADLVRAVKGGSSRWVHDTFPSLSGFGWQAGYAAFAVGRDAVGGVCRYIANQPEHHRAVSFQDEFRELLTANGLEWDERYAWD